MDKKFDVFLPLKKNYEGDDGFLYLDFGLSTTNPDLENDQMEEECIDDMIKQVVNLNCFQGHNYDKIIGPFVKGWKETIKDTIMMMVKVRVKPSMRKEVEEDIDTGVKQGGSIGGNLLQKFMNGNIRIIKKVQLLEGSLTPMPMNWETLGTAQRGTRKACKNPSMCGQIFKSIDKTDNREDDMTEDLEFKDIINKLYDIVKTVQDKPDPTVMLQVATELSDMSKAVTMLPGWPEDLNDPVKTDQAQLLSALGGVIENITQLVEDVVYDELNYLATLTVQGEA